MRNDSYPMDNAIEAASLKPQIHWISCSFAARELRAKLGRPIHWKASGSVRQGSSFWRCMPKRGRILKYTGQGASYNLCKDNTTVVKPHAIPGYNWRLKLVNTSECVRGPACSLSAQMCPFRYISRMCFVPHDEGPNQIPSTSEMDAGGRAGIGAEVPFESGTMRWEGRMGPSSCGMNGEGSESALILPMEERPWMNW